jgi:hypothetical protein
MRECLEINEWGNISWLLFGDSLDLNMFSYDFSQLLHDSFSSQFFGPNE